MEEEIELVNKMPSEEATDPDIPTQEPVAQTGDEEGGD